MNFALLGSYFPVMDMQRRFAMPRSWRRGENDVFYMFPFKKGIIQILIPERFELLLENIEKNTFAEHTLFLSQLASSFYSGHLDSQGKFTLSVELKDYAEIKSDLFIVGAFFSGLLVAKEKKSLLDKRLLKKEGLIHAFLDNDKGRIEEGLNLINRSSSSKKNE